MPTALIVHAHPEPTSFNAALRDTAAETLRAEGHAVLISDLYADGFDPVDRPGHFRSRLARAVFDLAREQGHAQLNDAVAPDIAAEQEKLRAADLVILQFPMWWYGMPAILKGWVDRVLAFKFAYDLGLWWDKGLLAGKRAMVSVTTGTPAGAYASDGRNGDIDRILWPINAGVLRICGFEVLPPFVVYGAPWLADSQRRHALTSYAQRLRELDITAPLFFHDLEDFGPDHRLRPGVVPNTPGQHRD